MVGEVRAAEDAEVVAEEVVRLVFGPLPFGVVCPPGRFRLTMDSLNSYMQMNDLPQAMRQRLRDYFHRTRHLWDSSTTQKVLVPLNAASPRALKTAGGMWDGVHGCHVSSQPLSQSPSGQPVFAAPQW